MARKLKTSYNSRQSLQFAFWYTVFEWAPYHSKEFPLYRAYMWPPCVWLQLRYDKPVSQGPLDVLLQLITFRNDDATIGVCCCVLGIYDSFATRQDQGHGRPHVISTEYVDCLFAFTIVLNNSKLKKFPNIPKTAFSRSLEPIETTPIDVKRKTAAISAP